MTDWVRRGKRDEIRGPFLESSGNFSNPESLLARSRETR